MQFPQHVLDSRIREWSRLKADTPSYHDQLTTSINLIGETKLLRDHEFYTNFHLSIHTAAFTGHLEGGILQIVAKQGISSRMLRKIIIFKQVPQKCHRKIKIKQKLQQQNCTF